LELTDWLAEVVKFKDLLPGVLTAIDYCLEAEFSTSPLFRKAGVVRSKGFYPICFKKVIHFVDSVAIGHVFY
jgi:hypothetical protein